MPAPVVAVVNFVKVFGPAILAIAVTGATWERTQHQLAGTVSLTRYEVEEARRDAQMDRLITEVREARESVDRLESRVSALYCGTDPRPGCR